MSLVGCPFCRELRPSEEGRQCSVCGVELVPIERLPLSYERRAEAAAALAATPPEHRPLPVWFLGRGRGALTGLAVLGLAAFFVPWVHLEKPADLWLSGFDLARQRAGWFWGGAVGWFVLLPVVVTRRTVAEMRGVRIVAATFPALTLIEAIVLVLNRPTGSRFVPVEFSWAWGLYASAVVSALGVLFGLRFGGAVDRAATGADPNEVVCEGSSEGRVLH
jgi:hypothetical protein